MHDLKRRLLAEGVVRLADRLAVADRQALHLRVEANGELLQRTSLFKDFFKDCFYLLFNLF